MNTSKKATLQSIADAVGVNMSVVSRVLNNKKCSIRTSARIKEAVLNEAVQQGYRLNSNIGVILPGFILEAYVQKFLLGVFKQANEHGFGTYFAACEADDSRDVPYFIQERQVSGIIFLATICEKIRAFCDEEKIPYLMINPIHERFDHDCVMVDDYGMIRELCEHLAEKGYRRYFWCTWKSSHFYVKKRTRAFEDFITENPDYYGETFILDDDKDTSSCKPRGIRDLVGQEGPETAIILCGGAFYILENCAAWHHKEFPRDIGFACENPLIDVSLDRMDRFAPPVMELGLRAIEMMKAKWDQQHQVQDNIIVKGKVIRSRA